MTAHNTAPAARLTRKGHHVCNIAPNTRPKKAIATSTFSRILFMTGHLRVSSEDQSTMKTLLRLAAVAILSLPAYAQGPNTVLIGTEGITVASVSSPTAVLLFGAGTSWNTVTAAKFPLLIACSGGCPLLGNDPAPMVPKSLYAVQQATAYTVTLSNGTKKTVPALPPVTTTYLITVTGTVTLANGAPMPTTLPVTNLKFTAVKQ